MNTLNYIYKRLLSTLNYTIKIFKDNLANNDKDFTLHALQERKEFIAKKVCMVYARGNISLKKGKYFTSDDINHRREKALNYVFKT